MRKRINRIIAAFTAAVIFVTGMPADIYAASGYEETAVYEQDAVTEDAAVYGLSEYEEGYAAVSEDTLAVSEDVDAEDADDDGIEALGATSFTEEMQQEWDMGDYSTVNDYPDRTGNYAHSSKFNTYEGVVGLKRYKGSSKNVTIYGDLELEDHPDTKLATVIEYSNVWQTGSGFLPYDTESVTFEDGVFLTSGSFLFSGCKKIKNIDLSPLSGPSQIKGQEDKDYVFDISYMFFGCSALETVKLGNLYPYPTNVNSMFQGCSSLKEVDLSSLDFSELAKGSKMYYSYMFDGCTSLAKIETPLHAPKGIGLMNTYMGSDGKTYTELPSGLSSSITLTKIADGVKPTEIKFMTEPITGIGEGCAFPKSLYIMIKPYYANDINFSFSYDDSVVHVYEESLLDTVRKPKDHELAQNADEEDGYIERVYQATSLKRGSTAIKIKDTGAPDVPEISLPVTVVRTSSNPGMTTYDSFLLKGWKEDVSEALKKNGWDGTGKLTSSDPKVAVIDAKGVVTGKGAGEAEIHWVSGDKDVNTEILVKVQIPKLTQKSVTLSYLGQETDARANIEDCDMVPASMESVKADVLAPVKNSDGVFGAAKAGTSKVNITWKSENPKVTGKTALSYSVKVAPVSMSKQSLTVVTGASTTLSLKNVNKSMNVIWCVDGDQDICEDEGYSNPYLSLVPKGSKCTVKALLPGERTVAAMVDDIKYECVINVPEPEVKKPEITLAKGKTDTFVLNAKTTKLKITAFKDWISSDDRVAKVNYDAKKKKYTIEAVGRGSCAIYADMGEAGYYLIHVNVTGDKNPDVDVPITSATGFTDKTIPSSASGTTTIGSTASDGLSIEVDPGTFDTDVKITTKPMDKEKLKEIGAFEGGVLEKIISPVEIECVATDGTAYKGEDLGAGTVVLTMPIPENDPSQIPYYMFAYFNEETGEIEYYYPDSYDLTNMTMSASVPHFSPHGLVKTSKQTAIDRYLDDYSMRVALEKLQQKEAQKILQPYLKKKATDLGLTVAALEDLVHNTVNWAGGKFNGPGASRVAAETKLASGLLRTYIDARDENGVIDPSKIDPESVQGAYEDFLIEGCGQTWTALGYDKKIVNGVEVIDESKTAPNEAIGWTISNANNVSKMLGAFAGGDKEEGFKAMGNIMKNSNRTVEFVTDMVHLTARTVNLTFTYWKSAQVDELYKVYKNGNDYCHAENWKEFETYLDFAPGLSNVKGLNRFYEMDKMQEYWDAVKESKKFAAYQALGYDELPDSVKGQLEDMAEKALKDYFEMRATQEKEAEKIKAEEKVVMESLLKDYGALAPMNKYSEASIAVAKSFGEESAEDYNIENRLKTISNIRNELEIYVDVDTVRRLAKDDSFNMGDLINSWVDIKAQLEKEQGGTLTPEEIAQKTREKFCEEWSKQEGIIKKEFRTLVPVESIDMYRMSKAEVDFTTGFTMKVGDCDSLKAVVSPDTASVQGVTWSSSSPDVVKASPRGKNAESSQVLYITAFKPGTSVITATSKNGTVSSSCTITVEEDIINDPLASTYMADMIKGWKMDIHDQAYDYYFNVLKYPASMFDGPKAKIYAKNTKAATLSGTTVTAKAAGTTDIYWKYDAGHGTGWDKKLGTIRVQEPRIVKSYMSVGVGRYASGWGNIKDCTVKPTRWASMNASIATVNSDGIIMGKRKGTTYIHAIYEGPMNTVYFRFQVNVN